MLTTYQTDGQQTVFSFDWPYLDRSHIMVTVNDAARSFKFIDDHTLRIVDLFGNPFAKGLPLKIFRVTPDLVSFAVFKDSAKLTAEDLNRARLQVLFLIQERSGGLGGSVAQAVQNLTNEIETISGALDSLAETQGVLQAGLSTLTGLTDRLTVVENGAAALRDAIAQELTDRTTADSQLSSRMDSLEIDATNTKASFHSDINLLTNQQDALASKTDELAAQLDSLDLDGDGNDDSDALAASIITSAIASAKLDHAQAQQIQTLEADLNDNVKAMIQVEQNARVTADQALAEQITSLQSEIDENIAQVVEDMKTTVDAVDGKVTGLSAQWTLKAQVQREDGTVVMGGIGLASTANDDYVGSKLVLMADSVLFADPNTPNGDLVPFLEAGLVDGAPTLVVPSARVGDKTLPGRVLVDGSVEARSIAANTITGDKLVAGTITTDKLSVGLGANLLTYSEFAVLQAGLQVPLGWSYGWTSDIQTAWMTVARDLGGYTLLGGHTLYVAQGGTSGNTNIGASFTQVYSDRIPVIAGNRYDFSVYAGAHRANVNCGVVWYDANDAQVGAAGLGSAADGTGLTADTWFGGPALSQYARIGAIATAPVGAATARFFMRKASHTTAQPNSYAFFTHPFFAESTPSATRLSPYTPGGQMTLITPQGISTPSLSALSANIGLLRTAASGQRLELDSNQLRVYDVNNVLRVELGVLS